MLRAKLRNGSRYRGTSLWVSEAVPISCRCAFVGAPTCGQKQLLAVDDATPRSALHRRATPFCGATERLTRPHAAGESAQRKRALRAVSFLLKSRTGQNISSGAPCYRLSRRGSDGARFPTGSSRSMRTRPHAAGEAAQWNALSRHVDSLCAAPAERNRGAHRVCRHNRALGTISCCE
jgi:hypothetical protein